MLSRRCDTGQVHALRKSAIRLLAWVAGAYVLVFSAGAAWLTSGKTPLHHAEIAEWLTECAAADDAPTGEPETENASEDTTADWLHPDVHSLFFADPLTSFSFTGWQESFHHLCFLSQATPPPERCCLSICG